MITSIEIYRHKSQIHSINSIYTRPAAMNTPCRFWWRFSGRLMYCLLLFSQNIFTLVFDIKNYPYLNINRLQTSSVRSGPKRIHRKHAPIRAFLIGRKIYRSVSVGIVVQLIGSLSELRSLFNFSGPIRMRALVCGVVVNSKGTNEKSLDKSYR